MSVRRFFGGALMVVGGLLALLSGGCTLFFVAQSLMAPNPSGQDVGGWLIVFGLVGALGFVPGLALLAVGRLLWVRSPPAPGPADDRGSPFV